MTWSRISPSVLVEAYVDQLTDFCPQRQRPEGTVDHVDDGIEGLRVAVAATCSLKTNTRVLVKDF